MPHAVKIILNRLYKQYKPVRYNQILAEDLKQISLLVELTEDIQDEITKYLTDLFISDFKN
jgi:hypothetical protein